MPTDHDRAGYFLHGTTIEEKLRLNHVVVDGCWRWTGAHMRKGYGQLHVVDKRVSVHRLAYEIWVGPIPEGLEIDHLCRVRDCINPQHLEAVTHAENLRRMAAARTECKNGHPYVEASTTVRRKPGKTCRVCLICRRASSRAARARRKDRGN